MDWFVDLCDAVHLLVVRFQILVDLDCRALDLDWLVSDHDLSFRRVVF